MAAFLLQLAGSLLRWLPLLAVWLGGWRSAQAKADAKGLEHAQKARRIDEEVARLDDAALRGELLKSSE
ncbi:MAG: hypothetical protein EPN26_08235 [Rhodospirillales bacterium]|nr:MAG: hypothetical protein EPN26_08235 [Rhodospirillales bacterium]